MDNQNTKMSMRMFCSKRVLILVLMDNQNTSVAGYAAAAVKSVLILVLMDNQNTTLLVILALSAMS